MLSCTLPQCLPLHYPNEVLLHITHVYICGVFTTACHSHPCSNPLPQLMVFLQQASRPCQRAPMLQICAHLSGKVSSTAAARAVSDHQHSIGGTAGLRPALRSAALQTWAQAASAQTQQQPGPVRHGPQALRRRADERWPAPTSTVTSAVSPGLLTSNTASAQSRRSGERHLAAHSHNGGPHEYTVAHRRSVAGRPAMAASSAARRGPGASSASAALLTNGTALATGRPPPGPHIWPLTADASARAASRTATCPPASAPR